MDTKSPKWSCFFCCTKLKEEEEAAEGEVCIGGARGTEVRGA